MIGRIVVMGVLQVRDKVYECEPLLEHTVRGMWNQETKAEGSSSNALEYIYCIYL